MNTQSAYPIIELAVTPKSLERVDILAPVAYVGEGFLKLADFGRLLNEAARVGTQDGFYCRLRSHHQNEVPVMEISLKGRLQLTCQRCLQPIVFEIEQQKNFVFLKTEAQADDFPIDNEGEEAMVASHHFDLLAAIEDEILLAIPYSSKHPIGECQISQEAGGAKPENPFKVLKNLKK